MNEINSILETAKEKITKLKDTTIEIILHERIKMSKSEQLVSWDNFRWHNIHVIRVPKEKRDQTEQGKKKKFET